MANMVKFSLKLEWKDHPVDLEALDAWMRDNVGHYCGNSADENALTLHFAEVPAASAVASAKAKWESIKKTNAMAKSYQSREDVLKEKAAKLDSAKAKLTALGLDADEVAALLGQ